MPEALDDSKITISIQNPHFTITVGVSALVFALKYLND
jgi:hypothetical protein